MKRSPLKRRTRLSPVSKKRSKQLKVYSSLRKAYIKEHPRCENCNAAFSSDIHHKKGRLGETLNDTEFWIAVCRACHNHIHRYPQLARDKGLIL